MIRNAAFIFIATFAIQPLHAQDAEPATEEVVASSKTSGEGSLGLVINSGNTNNEALNGAIKVLHESGKWLHTFGLTAKQVRESEVLTAKRYLFTEKTDYALSERTYAFGSLRYDDDRFDGFDYQSSLALGIGWHLIDSDATNFDVEVGLGTRRNKVATLETFDPVTGLLISTVPSMLIEETIGRFSEHFDTQLTETTSFTQDLLVESGDSNTTSELSLGLKVAINTALALQIGYNVRHNSDPPTNTGSTDRTTAVTLVFGF